ncbi:EamA/RhaT family transporter [Streptomyces sp. p1417]|uniref:EamA/RhaT family transporter n=1 Tax=Streptomyces typhae TaxID=2681492 RepID=A0A6L6WZ20_9ACTN|nr:EamA/RhaT family transporter [Streptomyces typhae]
MSEESPTAKPADAETTAAAAVGGTPAGPRPEPIRFFGTTWVDHTDRYGLRRAGVAVGSLAAAAAGCLVLRFAYQGLAIADVGAFVNVLVVIMFAICSAIAFRRTWDGFGKRHDPQSVASMRSLMTIGFIGSLLAYFFRALKEAPGEQLHRKEYEKARVRYEKRTARRAGHPSKRKRRK